PRQRDRPPFPTRRSSDLEAVAGRGLTGDRYYLSEGTFSRKEGPDREVTLIESEALDALARDCEIPLAHAQARRNLVTRGVPLNQDRKSTRLNSSHRTISY